MRGKAAHTQQLPSGECPGRQRDLREFIWEEAQAGWPYIRIIHDAKLNKPEAQDIAKILSTLIDMKKRMESDTKEQCDT